MKLIDEIWQKILNKITIIFMKIINEPKVEKNYGSE